MGVRNETTTCDVTGNGFIDHFLAFFLNVLLNLQCNIQ
jgi:hypothetical protein